MLPIYVAIITLLIISLATFYLLQRFTKNHTDIGQNNEAEVINDEPIERSNRPEQQRGNVDRNRSNQNQIPQTQYDPNKKLTKKEMYKMEKKKAKQDQREYMNQLQEEKRKRDEEKEMFYEKKEREREEEKMKEEEILIALREEKRKTEEAEFNTWKDDFIVEESGENQMDFNDENVLSEFISYIKLRKVVSLEDIGGVFKLSNKEIVDRLIGLESQGKIYGIIDDRGKYIYLTEKEICLIEKLFMNRGRISRGDLIKECNKLIRFEPTEEDKQSIKNQQSSIVEQFAIRE